MPKKNYYVQYRQAGDNELKDQGWEKGKYSRRIGGFLWAKEIIKVTDAEIDDLDTVMSNIALNTPQKVSQDSLETLMEAMTLQEEQKAGGRRRRRRSTRRKRKRTQRKSVQRKRKNKTHTRHRR